MEDKYKKIIKALGTQRVKINEPLSFHTTIKIGGPADLFFEATTENELIKAVNLCKSENISYFILGWGSNTLVGDKGFKGIVVKNNVSKINIMAVKGKMKSDEKKIEKVLVEATSGTSISQLVRFTLEEGLSGFEYFLGLPGTIGGAVSGNAHNMRWNKFIGDLLVQARIINQKGEIEKVNKTYFKFSYDTSYLPNISSILLSAIFELKAKNKEELWKIATEESLYRQKTQPNLPSLGCTFKNINKGDAMRLATPKYTTSVGFLIDSCNLKGTKIGGAEISKTHANFIVNKDGATASDVVQLIHLCKEKVKEKFCLNLEEEIRFLGEF